MSMLSVFKNPLLLNGIAALGGYILGSLVDNLWEAGQFYGFGVGVCNVTPNVKLGLDDLILILIGAGIALVGYFGVLKAPAWLLWLGLAWILAQLVQKLWEI